VPAHHEIEAFTDSYLQAAQLVGQIGTPLFRACGRKGDLSQSPLTRVDVYRMIQRRARAGRLNIDLCCHSFRATGITAYLHNGGTLENAQIMAAHKSPRTTKLYDRTNDKIMLEEVQRIVI
jgi:integrase